MRKLAIASAAVLFSATLNVAPALADDKGGLKSAAWFPVQVLGVGSALAVGTPIAITRRVSVRIREYTAAAADKIGGHEHFPPNLFASFYSVPVGTLVGTAEGVYQGGKTAIKNGVEKPFSVDSFSLGDLEE